MKRLYPVYSELALKVLDFAKCQRPDGTIYGIADGKQCRKGSKMSIGDLPEEYRDKAMAAAKTLEERVNERAKITKMYPAAVARFEPLQRLDGDEKAALELYGAIDKLHLDINSMKRGGVTPADSGRAAVTKYTSDHLESALKKLPNVEAELERMVSGNFAAGLEKLSVGTVIRDDGFGSYTNKGGPTLDQFVQRGAANAVIRVRAKTVKNVEEAMKYREGEHISLPGTQWKLVEKQEYGHYSRKVGELPAYIFEEV
jgi:hypothetical protein